MPSEITQEQRDAIEAILDREEFEAKDNLDCCAGLHRDRTVALRALLSAYDEQKRLAEANAQHLVAEQEVHARTSADLDETTEKLSTAEKLAEERQEELKLLKARMDRCDLDDFYTEKRLRAKLFKAQRLAEERGRELEMLNSGKSPCGHWAAHARTADGGKTITCLECQVEERGREIERLAREVDLLGLKSLPQLFMSEVEKREEKLKAAEAKVAELASGTLPVGKHFGCHPEGSCLVCDAGVDEARDRDEARAKVAELERERQAEQASHEAKRDRAWQAGYDYGVKQRSDELAANQRLLQAEQSAHEQTRRDIAQLDRLIKAEQQGWAKSAARAEKLREALKDMSAYVDDAEATLLALVNRSRKVDDRLVGNLSGILKTITAQARAALAETGGSDPVALRQPKDIAAELRLAIPHVERAIAAIEEAQRAPIPNLHIGSEAQALAPAAPEPELGSKILDAARGTLLICMDALESDANIDQRRAAFEFCQDRFGGLDAGEYERAAEWRRKALGEPADEKGGGE